MTLAEQFLELINSRAREERIHHFLVENPEILYTALHGSDQILSKPNLHRYIPDFAAGVEQMTTRRWSWILVEIEPAEFPLITNDGNPTAKLTHAVRQVSDWRDWISENTAYARSILPDITPACHGLIVMGRRGTINANLSRQLRAYRDSLSRIEIHSYDWLYDTLVKQAERGFPRRSLCIHRNWRERAECSDDD
jgi:hypothetical protein